MISTDYEKFQTNLKKRVVEDKAAGFKTAAEMKKLNAETGIDFTNDYTRYHWDTYEERSPVQSYGHLSELDDLVYSQYEYQDPDWSDSPSLY